MRFVDAHIHLSDSEYTANVDEVIKEAVNSNVVAIVSNSMDCETSLATVALAQEYPRIVYAAVGIHPWSVRDLSEDEYKRTLEIIETEIQNGIVVAVGEIGLDYKYQDVWEKQLTVFGKMVNIAEEAGLPAIIHSRGTTVQIMDMLPSYNLQRVMLHWFSSPINELKRIVDCGYFITEGPPSLYSKGIREIVRRVPLTNLLTETDGPIRFYGNPFKGKVATPAFIPSVVKAMADIKNMQTEDMAAQLARNFEEFFSVKLQSR